MEQQEREAQFHQDKKEPGTRSKFERDRDRVLYSSAFRRLGGVTQTALAQEGLHNRLVHSLKVAQVGVRLAQNFIRKSSAPDPALMQRLGGLDENVVETAGLAHDLGHPPFGHVGEAALNKALRERGVADGFEGNAQAFRIVTRLAVVIFLPGFQGLNLTRASLNATLKYPRPRPDGEEGKDREDGTPPKFGFYQTERNYFEWAREGLEASGDRKTLEAEIMDWADDIAYAVHDVEDFYRIGFIPLGELASHGSLVTQEFLRHAIDEWKTDPPLGTTVDEDYIRQLMQHALGTSPFGRGYKGTTFHRANLRNWGTRLTSDFITSAEIEEGGFEPGYEARMQVELLKQLTRFFVVRSGALATQQVGQRRIIAGLFDTYADILEGAHKKGRPPTEDELSVFPPGVQVEVREATTKEGGQDWWDDEVKRLIADGIASMTEEQAYRMFGRLHGGELGSVIDPIVR